MGTRRGGQPLYVLIADKLRQQIREGHYAPGQRLPAEAELLEHHGVSLMTMRRSLAVLREEGLIATRRGSQALVRTQPVRRTLTLGPGTRLIGRMPTAPERLALGLERGVPLLEIHGADGTVEVLGADQVEVVQPPSAKR